jgi:peptidyl-prolyl cis-trans isomerase A (cyclophilin A)
MPSTRSITMIALVAALAATATPVLAQAAKTTPQRGRGTTAAGAGRGTTAAAAVARLKNPAALKDVAPAEFRAVFDTSAGPFVVLVHRAWAPRGADRFYNLVKYGFFDNCRFFRVLPNFMVQFGINGDPAVQSHWVNADFPDDPTKESNKRGTITFANRGPNSRSTQVFINFTDNGTAGAMLDRQGFAPFGEIVSGMEAVDKINAEYREKPDQGAIQRQGNAYLTPAFPRMDYVKKATIERPAPKPAAGRGTGR